MHPASVTPARPALPAWVRPSFLALVIPFLPAASPAADPPVNPSPDGSYELHTGLELTLFAREPDVVDPVALTFDALGRAYVVEMRDYPYGFGPERRPGGTIRLIEDTDGDGRVDRSVVFASNLSFPTSVAAWEDGVLVMAPPEVLFLRDIDGDGRADQREIVMRGLKLGVTDSNANGLRWAFDNWMHAVNGGNGGTVSMPRGNQPPLRLGDRDFRFRPQTGEVERTFHTGGGFGLVFDDWGRSFTPHNINHMQQRVAHADALARFPGLPAFETTHSISDHGDMARIFAVSTAVTRPNHPEQAGYFSSAGSMGHLGHQAWPGDLPGSVFVCDVVGNLVHRDVLSPDGPILKASRAPGDEAREFFASRDQAFRPTGLELGPDGALYLLDMQRDVIEHPDYIPRKLLETLDVRAGENRGRIYRIAPAGWPRKRELPGRASPADRVAMLASPNQWTRLTAQRLLVASPDPALLPALRKLASGSNPLGRLHAVWTLDGFGALRETDLVRVLADPHPRVRASFAALAAARFPESKTLRSAIVRQLADPDPEVRFQALLALATLPGRPPLPQVLETYWRDRQEPWSRRAALATLHPGDEALAIPALFASEQVALDLARHTRIDNDAGAADAIRDLADLTGARAGAPDAPNPGPALELVLRQPRLPASLRVAFLHGLASGLERSEARPTLAGPAIEALRSALDPENPVLLAAAWKVARLCGVPETDAQRASLAGAIQTARDPLAPLDHRINAIALLALADPATSTPVLLECLDGREPLPLQQAALERLRHSREPRVGEGLVRAWKGLSPSLRAPVVNLLVYRHPFHPALLLALESGTLQVGELNLDLEHRRQLLRHASPPIRERAARFMSDEEYSNRNAAVADWLARLPADGDPARGRPHFERVCAQCHRVGPLGFQVGPDLTGMSHRSVEDLLSNILDPNMAMNPAYVAFTAERRDGEAESGILLAETTDAITLVQAGGRTISIPRTQIDSLRSEGKSLMPEGLEAGLTPQDLRDLIAFLQSPPPPPPPPTP